MSYAQKMLDALDKQNLPLANEMFTEALKKDDDDTLYGLAEELYALGFLQQAKQIYEHLLKLYPEEDNIKTILADIAISNGDTDTALNYLADIEPTSPAYAASLLTAADLYQTLGMTEVSEQKLMEGMRLYPDEPVMTFALAELEYNDGNYTAAIALYQSLLADDVKEMSGVNIKLRLASAETLHGDFEAAYADFKDIPHPQFSNDELFQLGMVDVQLHEYQQAVTVLTELQQRDEQYTSLYPVLAEAQEKLGQLHEALQTVQIGLGMDEFNERLNKRGSEIAIKLGDFKLGEEYLQAALKINPDNMSTIVALSNLLIDQKRYDENIDLLRPVLKDHQDVDPQIYWNLGRSYLAKDEVVPANDAYMQAYDAFHQQPSFLRDLITLFQMSGEKQQLISALKRYLKLQPDDMDMQDLLDSYLNEND